MTPDRGLIKLALFGNAPAFPEKLYVGNPNIGDRQRLNQRIDEILNSRWLTNNGPFVRQLEEQIAARLDVKHCITVCNATLGLEIVSRALDLREEVIVPSFTFVASAHALRWVGLRPVFADIDEATHNIDPVQVERLITPQTSAVLGVHVWGRPCEIEALSEIARRRGVKLFFDAAHAFDCSYKGRMIGNFGEAEVFSFHATKFFNTLEGGAILTNNDALAEKTRKMKNFGFHGGDNARLLGTNAKMNEVSAAMGLTLLESLDEIVAANHRNYVAYRSGLEGIPGVKLIAYDEREKCNYQYIILEIDQSITQVGRDQLSAILNAENVMVRRYFYPGIHRMEAYTPAPAPYALSLPVTERLAERVLALPTGPAVNVEKIKIICGLVRTVVEHGAQIKSRIEHYEAAGLLDISHSSPEPLLTDV